MSDVASIELPAWAQVSPRREAHIRRVVALITRWAEQMHIASDERDAWHDAALFHDCLRDAPVETLREIVADPTIPDPLLHGPAAAVVLAREGETRIDVLEAVRWHTVGCSSWARTGRALYMADYLEPGRPFGRVDRAYLADRVPTDFDGTLRQVVRERLEWMLREGFEIPKETVELWNDLQ
jgi:2-amino-4-hydroxy-6-hydroxymethyldihydropteridine diphosphokinase